MYSSESIALFEKAILVVLDCFLLVIAINIAIGVYKEIKAQKPNAGSIFLLALTLAGIVAIALGAYKI